tara:strand:- start:985 stop:1239 length:255 start_codon:yes stop_codon:yes gene_type:complete
MSIDEGDYGRILVIEGEYKGLEGFYDDDEMVYPENYDHDLEYPDEYYQKNVYNRAIVYLDDIEGYVIIPYEYLKSLEEEENELN